MDTIKVIGSPLYQWEIGRKVQITPPPNTSVDRVEFSHKGDTDALCVLPREENGVIVADVPNIMLQSSAQLFVYLVYTPEGSVETTTFRILPVIVRPKPSDYAYTETEVMTWQALAKQTEDVIAEAKEVNQKTEETVNEALKEVAETAVAINNVKEDAENAVVYHKAQALTEEQQAQARKNIGAQIANFVVTFEQNEPYAADKTFEEVKAAYEAGATIVGVMDGNLYEMYSDGGGEGFGFICRVVNDTNYKMIWLWYDNSVTFDNEYLYINYPVQSVNGKTGAVQLTAGDVGALPDTTELPEVPETLPNPNPLTFTGAVEGSYDGSESVSIEIPTIAGEPGADGITPHIGDNGNWWIGETDTGVSASGSGESGDSGGIPIPATAEIGQTIVVTAVDESGKPTAWEAADLEKTETLVFESGPITEEVSTLTIPILLGDASVADCEKLLNIDVVEMVAYIVAPSSESTDATSKGKVKFGLAGDAASWYTMIANNVACAPVPAVTSSPTTTITARFFLAGEKNKTQQTTFTPSRSGILQTVIAPANETATITTGQGNMTFRTSTATKVQYVTYLWLTSTTPIGVGSYIKMTLTRYDA